MKKGFALLLAMLMTLSMVSFSYAEETPNMPIVQEPIYLKGYTMQSPQGGIANDMIAWQRLAEMTNIYIDWVDVPSESSAEVMSVMLASGDLPDLMYATVADTDLVRYGAAGVFADLTDLISDNCYYFQRNILSKYPDVLGGITMGNGRIYSLPQLLVGDNLRSMKLFINPDWLAAVGMEMPTNFKEFEAVLYAFRDNDCNGNGDPNDEIPYIIRYNNNHFLPSLYNFFGLGNRGTGHRYVDWDYENNCLRFIPTTPQFRDLLTVAHKWYKDGILDPELFQTTSSKQIAAKGSVNLVGVHSDYVTNVGSVYQDIFRAIPVMDNYYGEKTWTRFSPLVASRGAFVVSAKCPYVKELLKWADYFFSEEGQLMFNMGIEGITYEMVDGVPEWKDELLHNPEGLNLTQVKVRYMGFQGGVGANTDETYKGAETYWTSTELMSDYAKYMPETIWEKFNPTPEQSEEMEYIWADIEAYLNESIATFITGDRSLDEWDNYVKTIEGMNLSRYMEIYNEEYQTYMAAGK